MTQGRATLRKQPAALNRQPCLLIYFDLAVVTAVLSGPQRPKQQLQLSVYNTRRPRCRVLCVRLFELRCFSTSVLSLNFVFVFFSLDERVPGQPIDASSFQTQTSQNAKTEHLLQLARLSQKAIAQ